MNAECPGGAAGWRRVLTLILAVPACLLAYQLGLALRPPNTADRSNSSPPLRLSSGLEAELKGLEVGEVWEDPSYQTIVVVKNRADHRIEVSDLSGSCACTLVEPRSFTLNPGEEVSIRVTIDLTHRFPHQFGVERRELSIDLRPTLRDRGVTADGWRVTGVIRSRVSLDSRDLAFMDLCQEDGPPVSRRMGLTAHVPLTALRAEVPPGVATAQVVPVAEQPGRYHVVVTPNTHMPRGPFRFKVILTAELPDGRVLRVSEFPVEGEIAPPVRVAPDCTDLGDQPVGTKAETVVTVILPQGAEWSVGRVDSAAANTTIKSGPIVDGNPTYLVSYPIDQVGRRSTQVRFLAVRTNGASELVTAQVRANGISPPQEVRK